MFMTYSTQFCGAFYALFPTPQPKKNIVILLKRSILTEHTILSELLDTQIRMLGYILLPQYHIGQVLHKDYRKEKGVRETFTEGDLDFQSTVTYLHLLFGGYLHSISRWSNAPNRLPK